MTTKTINILPALLLSVTLVLAAALPARAGIRPGVTYSGGGLTLEANNATVGELLEIIARTAGVDVFVSRDFQAKQTRITLNLDKEPLEEALKRILRGYNYAAIYEKEGNDFRIAAVRIYPEGKMTGEVVPLFAGSRTALFEEKTRRGETVTVLVNTEGEMITHGNALERRGAVAPSQTELSASETGADLQKPWVALQFQQEREEAARFADLLMLRSQVENTADAGQKKILAMAYADEVAKFQTFKRANMNKVESLKRVSLYQEVKRK